MSKHVVLRLRDMDVIRAVVLGLVQGLTEFWPVSSSGHLVVVRHLFGWADEGLAFDAVLHLGTFLAALVYFRATILRLLRGEERPLLRALFLGTIPGTLAGFFGERLIADTFRGLMPIGISFLITAALLAGAEVLFRRRRPVAGEPSLAPSTALIVGIAQAAALVPGLSRSGLTIAAGMFRGLSRERAVAFSFLLVLPITAFAGLEGLRELVESGGSRLPALIGTGVAFVCGLASIAFLLRVVRRTTFMPYVLYLLVAGFLVLRGW